MCLSEQINLRGLDGIQGPVYVGTGCVFNRTALYGYEPPLKPKHKKPGLLSPLCGGNRKKSSKSSKKGTDKKKSNKHVDPTVPIFNLEDIEEGVEGTSIVIFFLKLASAFCFHCIAWSTIQIIFHQMCNFRAFKTTLWGYLLSN